MSVTINNKKICEFFQKYPDINLENLLCNFIDLIEKVQRQFTKRISGLNKLSYTQRLKELNLPSLEFRRARGDMIETYKILTNIYDPIITKSLMQVNTTTKTRTHTFKLHKDRFNPIK